MGRNWVITMFNVLVEMTCHQDEFLDLRNCFHSCYTNWTKIWSNFSVVLASCRKLILIYGELIFIMHVHTNYRWLEVFELFKFISFRVGVVLCISRSIYPFQCQYYLYTSEVRYLCYKCWACLNLLSNSLKIGTWACNFYR